MTSTRKYKQYIKLKFDIDEPIGGIIGDGYDEEAFQRLYGKAFRKAGLGFTANWAGMPTENEVRFTKLEESYQINILNTQTAEYRNYDVDTKYSLSETAEQILSDYGLIVSWTDNSKEVPRTEDDVWVPRKLYIDTKVAEEHGLFYIYKWYDTTKTEDWAADFHIRADPDNHSMNDLNIYGFSVLTEVNEDNEWTSIQISMTCAANKASTFVDADDKLQKFVGWIRRTITTAIPLCRSSISCHGEVEIERDIACTKFVDEEEE